MLQARLFTQWDEFSNNEISALRRCVHTGTVPDPRDLHLYIALQRGNFRFHKQAMPFGRDNFSFKFVVCT